MFVVIYVKINRAANFFFVREIESGKYVCAIYESSGL